MSKYTTEVRYICETAAGLDESVGYDSINSVVQEAAPKIFNFDFPIFDSAYRLPLEMKILKHYYTREICEETVGLWKLRLETRMNEIMPYYNKLYTSETLQFNPLYDVDYTREYTKDTSGETTGTEVVRDSGTVADAKTGSDTLTDTVSDVLEKTGTESVARTGTDTLDRTGTDTVTNSGTDTSAKTGTETVRDTGTDTSAKTGTETVEDRGTETNNKTGTEQVGSSGTITDQGTNSNTETRNYSDATTIGKDTWDLYSDTPQGGINGLLDNGQVESGTDLPNNTYLTNARHIMESGNAGTTVHSGTVGNSGSNSNTRTLGTTETTTHNTQDQKTLNTTETTTHATQDQRTLNTTETKTYDTEDERTLNTTEQRTLNTKDKTTVALDDTTTFDTEDSRDISGTHQQTYNSTNTKTLNTTKSGNTSGTITNTDEYVERVYGKTGGYTYSKALMEYRKTLLNIDMMIIDDLKDLFFGLW